MSKKKKIQTDITLKKFKLDKLKPAKYNPRTISDENNSKI